MLFYKNDIKGNQVNHANHGSDSCTWKIQTAKLSFVLQYVKVKCKNCQDQLLCTF